MSHPLKTAVTKHKARLGAELTKARLRRSFASLEALREHVNTGKERNTTLVGAQPKGERPDATSWSHPRWVRINTIRSTLDEQLATTFVGYKHIGRLEDIVATSKDSSDPVLHIDEHIPNLVAIPSGTDLTGSAAYRKGLIILQDKASCFPAYLLDPKTDHGDCLDACAAPGNKTTHVAAILKTCGIDESPTIWACERDKGRAVVLQNMVERAGAKHFVRVKAGQDFLKLDPDKEPWCGVGALLLDPSCSGSGIVGRDDMPPLTLPEKEVSPSDKPNAKKRKRKALSNPTPAPALEAPVEVDEEIPLAQNQSEDKLRGRLEALSAFQLKLLLHAFRFPTARKVTYSTCSVHAEENEHVVVKALNSPVALQMGWHILRRELQVPGMKAWDLRGQVEECGGLSPGIMHTSEEISDACIRCEKGTKEGTQGFFVAGFVRDDVETTTTGADRGRKAPLNSSDGSSMDGEWEGFGDEGSVLTTAPNGEQLEHHADGKEVIAKAAKYRLR